MKESVGQAIASFMEDNSASMGINKLWGDFKNICLYSQTCVKQAPLGKPKTGCLRQVLAKDR